MKRTFWFAILSVLLAAPSWLAAQESHGDYDHGSVGIFADYFRFAPTSNSHTNFIGFGARAGFNANRYVAIEGEMNYDLSATSQISQITAEAPRSRPRGCVRLPVCLALNSRRRVRSSSL